MASGRLGDMLDRYGEVATRAQAARILGCSVSKIRMMLLDGRLETCCAGTRVDVRSIAEYIERPAEIDQETRNRKAGRMWAV